MHNSQLLIVNKKPLTIKSSSMLFFKINIATDDQYTSNIYCTLGVTV